ncbi:MAG: hypothetical protein ACRDWE_13730, partial [Acidimicrobiales bacterium]
LGSGPALRRGPFHHVSHTLQVRSGRNSSGTRAFDAAEGEVVAYRCTGKRIAPLLLASFFMPRLALKLTRHFA